MSYKRFQALKRHLHFSDNAQFDAETLPNPKLNKIFPVYELLVRKFQSLYMPGRDVTINESLMLYKGRLGWVQYIPLKRARFGIKLFLLCESKSGYVWSMIIYIGKGTQLNPLYEGMPVSSQVVLSLMQPLLGNEHCVTKDNFYTSPQLADHLINNNTDIYGTVKPTRKEMPPEMKKKKLKKGEIQAFQRGKVTVMKWKDKRDVTLLSTVHNASVTTVPRYQKEVSIPTIVQDYNNTMGGVDRVDQALSAYPIIRKRGKKYYRKLFFNLVEITVWNSYLLFQSMGNTMKHLEFRMQLIELLVANHKEASPATRGRPGNPFLQ